MKKIENTFAVTGFVGKDASIRDFENASVARFSLAISKGEKVNDFFEENTKLLLSGKHVQGSIITDFLALQTPSLERKLTVIR